MKLLAHRGFWRTPDQKNSRGAFKDAFAAGYGVELDVRDQAGCLVIAHDLPTGECMTFAAVLDDYVALGATGTIAINIKADGLAALIKTEVNAAGLVSRCFVFDMSVPDLVTFMGTGVPIFHRRSEIEPASAIDDRTDGVWLDFFRGAWADPSVMTEQLWLGRSVAVVSPELHRQPHLAGWATMRAALGRSGLPAPIVSERLMLCTDFPDEAAAFFARPSETGFP